MPAPKEQGKIPIAMGVKYVKKAGSWLFYKNFKIENTSDLMKWCENETQALEEYAKNK